MNPTEAGTFGCSTRAHCILIFQTVNSLLLHLGLDSDGINSLPVEVGLLFVGVSNHVFVLCL